MLNANNWSIHLADTPICPYKASGTIIIIIMEISVLVNYVCTPNKGLKN